ncbi:MAG: DUF2723 domain-containing protein [Anaerolineaceae bacterium]|nr:DUF2723 domain-containing protein [Anaerolineaceae bacterium]
MKRMLKAASLFILTFSVYIKTLAPGVVGFDSAELITGIYTQGIVHPTGYPTYLILGRIFSFLPFGNSAFRINSMSAFFASLTVLLLYFILLHLLKNWKLAWLSAFLFAVSNYFWQMALVAEVYTLHTFFLSLNLFWVMRWREGGNFRNLYAFAFTMGLSLTNHVSSAVFMPGFAWLILSSKYWKWPQWNTLLKLGVLFFLGLTPYIYLPIRAASHPLLNYAETYYEVDLTTFKGVWWMISGEAYQFYTFAYSLKQIPGEIMKFLGFLWRNFFGVGIFFGLAGLFHLWKKDRHMLAGLFLVFLANAAFFINYAVFDKDTMFLPAYLIWAIFCAYGLLAIHDWLEEWMQTAGLPRFVKTSFLIMLVLTNILALGLNWKWLDMSEHTVAADFAQEVLLNASEDATVIASWSPAVVLEYYQLVEGQRPDLNIINRSRYNVANYYAVDSTTALSRSEILKEIQKIELEVVNCELGKRSVYMTEYDSLFAQYFDYIPEGNYFRLTSPQSSNCEVSQQN